MQCLACGLAHPQPVAQGQTGRKHGAAIVALGKVERRARVRIVAPIAQACGGYLTERGLILVTGPAGVGKSTEVARLVVKLGALGKTHVIMDREMEADLCADVYTRAGASPAFVESVRRVENARDWGKAFQLVEATLPDVVVVDSLDRWAEGSERTRGEIMRDLADPETGLKTKALVIVVAQWARAGHVKGSTNADHGADAVVIITKRTIKQDKCRWNPPKSIKRRRFV